MPPKPTNPTSKDLEDAIQATHQLMEQSLNATHSHFTEQLGIMNTKLDNQQQLLDSRDFNFQKLLDERHEALTSLITAALHSRPPPSDPPPLRLAGNNTSLTLNQPTTLPISPISPFSSQPLPTITFTPPPSPTPIQLTTNLPQFTPFHSTITNPMFTSPTTPIPVAIPTIQTQPPLPPPIIHTSPFRHTPVYTPQPSVNNAIPFGTFQPQPQSFNQNIQSPYATHPTPNQFSHTFRTPKIELSVFDGSEPLEWLFQAEQFFSFYNIPSENRLSLASFYMKGDALSWFKWMHQNHQLFDWTSFSKTLELRFGPSTYENHQAQLFKLRQYGSVTDYQTQFEKLGNRVIGLPPEALLNCFISGLIPEIRHELAVQKPYTITQAIGLAKLIEAKIKDSKVRPNRQYTPQHTTNTPLLPSSIRVPTPTHTDTRLTPPPQTATPTPPQNTKLPIRRLSAAQMQERRAQGLCYNCDEKYIAGHRCATGKYLLLIIDPDEEPTELPDSIDPDDDTVATYFYLSLQAVTGQPSPRTLKFKGSIYGLPVSVLIDTGSTHNIMQPRIAHHLQIPHNSIPRFSVMVGNGSRIHCSGFCPQVPINLQHNFFHIPFYLIPIEGADVVLGMEWLQTLGPIAADFAVPSISFVHNNNTITLQNDLSTQPSPSTFHHICHLVHTNSIASMHLLTYTPIPHKETTNQPQQLTDTIPPDIQQLLNTYPTVFQKPHGLPPPRHHDHHIPLQPNTAPINVKPYRYPHSQKEAMTTIIHDMLKDGIIIPSNSPYSSPVLLVRKKDGTWRFCVDYRALNAVTVRDRFPIPTIDELLDELGSATVFTKMDLRSGYHQIRVMPNDTHKTAFRTFDGHYEFLVMPFGLSNAPSTFQSAMNDLFRPFLRKFILVFFDDILIFSNSHSDHVQHLKLVLQLLHDSKFFAKLSKCIFAVPQVDYLGHVISAAGVQPDPEKIEAILSWPVPKSLTALRGFLGLTGFYRRFVRNYATIAAPLTDLLKITKYTWNLQANDAFTTLKKAMTSTPVLILPDFSKPFMLETDASAVAIGAVLSQDGHPLAFFSRKMCNRMQQASVYVRELFAITEAVKKWRQYLIGRHFHIFTDQKSLKELLIQTIQTPEQQKWAAKLQGFSFDIHYKPGKTNLVADALSRQFIDDSSSVLMAVSSTVPTLLQELRTFYLNNQEGK